MTFRVVVTDGVAAKGLEPLSRDDRFEVLAIPDSNSDNFAEALLTADGLIVRSATKVDEKKLADAPLLKVIGRAGVGVDNVDLAAATDRGVAVYNAPSGNTIAATELTMALLLSLIRKIPAADSSVREGRWDRAKFKGNELKGRTLGLIGAGRIGGEVAIRCQAFGMDVVIYDPYLSEGRAVELGAQLVSLDSVLEHADVISIHVPLTDETRGLVGAEILKRMKDHVLIVNASRGGVIDEDALSEALNAGEIAGAALDVYETEPLPADSPLRDAPNLVLTPHIGASTAEAQVAVALEVAESLIMCLGDNDRSGAVNEADLG